MTSARLLLADELPTFPRLRAFVGDRGYRGLAKLADRHGLALDIKRPPTASEQGHRDGAVATIRASSRGDRAGSEKRIAARIGRV